ncbi:hypothetical protein LTR27_004726 [Elasticomyces elasticus]|nr:hypothetical protein LTR27_004726 [Elasticomyces elasticus]
MTDILYLPTSTSTWSNISSSYVSSTTEPPTVSLTGPASDVTSGTANTLRNSTYSGSGYEYAPASSSASFNISVAKTPPQSTASSSAPLNSANATSGLTLTSSLSGDCAQQWAQYWLGGPRTTTTTIDYGNVTFTTANTQYRLDETSWLESVQPASTYLQTLTEVAENGPNHIMSTYETTQAMIKSAESVYSYSVNTESTVTTLRTTVTGTYADKDYTTLSWNVAYPKPTCVLPSNIQPTCQAQWVTFIANDQLWYDNPYPKPNCTQAAITGGACSSLVSAYFMNYTMYGQATNPGYISTSGSYSWPSTSAFAPGCTLGCQTCAITGQNVQLYYWPPATAASGAAFIDGNGTATAMPNVNSMNASTPVIANVDGTLLTSPTIYISYDKLYASDSCSGIGQTYYNTIIPLADGAELSSMEYREMRDMAWFYATSSFNLDDLKQPVPDSIYNKQPRCAASSLAFYGEGLGLDYSFVCPRIHPYAPIIAVPSEVSNVDPEWASCTAWYGGLFDPPKALTPVSNAAGLSTAYVVSTTSASPGSTITGSGPAQTAAPYQSTGPSATASATQTHTQPTTYSTAAIQSPNSVAADTHTQSSTRTLDHLDSTQITKANPDESESGAPAASPYLSSPQNAQPSSSDAINPLLSAISQVAASTETSADPTEAADAGVLLSIINQLSGSTSATSDRPDPTSPSAYTAPIVVTGGSNSAVLTASPVGSSLVAIAIGDSFTTIAAGQAGTIAGHSVSIASSYVQVDGTNTVLLPVVSPVVALGSQDPVIIIATASDGHAISAYQSAGSVIVQDVSSTVTLAPGQASVVAGQSISAVADGAGIVVDGGRTVPLSPTAADIQAGTGALGSEATLSPSSNEPMLLGVGSLTIAMNAGEVTTLGTQTFSAPLAGSYIVVVDGTSTVSFGAAAASSTDVETTILGAQGQSIRLVQSSGYLIAADASATTTIGPGQTATFGGRTLGAASGYAVLDGSGTLGPVAVGIVSAAGASITGIHGQAIHISEHDGEEEIDAGGLTVTLDPGQATVVDSRTISAVADGHGVVVDGTSTLTLAAAESASSDPDAATITGSQGETLVISEEQSLGALEIADGSTTVTLRAGQATTIDGRTISAAAPSGSGSEWAVVVDGSQTLLRHATTTSDGGASASSDPSVLQTSSSSQSSEEPPAPSSLSSAARAVRSAPWILLTCCCWMLAAAWMGIQ